MSVTLFRCFLSYIQESSIYGIEEEIIRHAWRGDIAYPIINTGSEVPLPIPFKMVMPVVYTIYFTWNYLQQTGTKIIDDI